MKDTTTLAADYEKKLAAKDQEIAQLRADLAYAQHELEGVRAKQKERKKKADEKVEDGKTDEGATGGEAGTDGGDPGPS